ncbi:MAG TPA: SRPBCC family protein [Streptosporangiaceae bacterium]|jgi:hypothetical protein
MESNHYPDADRPASAAALTASIAIRARLPVVWDIHIDVLGWPGWHSLVSRTQAGQPLTSGARFRWQCQEADVTSYVAEWDERRSMAWRLSGSLAAVLTWTFASTARGTRVSARLSPDGGSAAKHQAVLAAALGPWLRDLKRAAERASATPAITD